MLQFARTRYYVHGDLNEKHANMYYCASCDLFAPPVHFIDSHHVSTRAEVYDRSLKSLARHAKNRNSPFYHPADAENIIADLAAADVKTAIDARSPFFRWISRQTKRNDPIGDLARDVESDSSFPRTNTSLEAVRLYLMHKQAVSEAIVAFDEACREFKAKRKARDGISVSIRFAVFKRDSYRCCLCGASAQSGSKLEVDHKVAVAKGGTNNDDNLWTLCFECNRGKGVHDI